MPSLNLYEKLALRVSSLIEQGALKPGTRVPSVRRLAREQKVSISTVLQAYILLEDRGFIEARPQSGFYVRLQTSTLPPEPKISKPACQATAVKVSDLVSNIFREARDPNLVQLGAACPSPELFPNTRLNRILAAQARKAGASANTYDFPPGLLALRQQIARRSLGMGCSLSPDEIVTTVGAMEAVNLCLRAVAGPGDIIAIESPTYYGHLQAIESMGMVALEIPTDPREGLCLDHLETALKENPVKAVLAMPNFSNPLGSQMSDENKERLVDMLGKRGIPLIEDDVHSDLGFDEGRPRPAKAFDTKGLVMLCSSFSKTLAPGHRVGWVAPGRYQARVEKLKFISTVATQTLSQMAIAEFLKSGGYDHHLRSLRRAFCTQMQVASQAISKYFPEGTKLTRPRGGFVLWVELPKHVDSLDLHRKALAERISIIPGPIFSAKQKFRNFIRISCGEPWSERTEWAFRRLGQLAGQL